MSSFVSVGSHTALFSVHHPTSVCVQAAGAMVVLDIDLWPNPELTTHHPNPIHNTLGPTRMQATLATVVLNIDGWAFPKPETLDPRP